LLLLLLLLLVLLLLINLLLQQHLLMAFAHNPDAIARASSAMAAMSSRTRTCLATINAQLGRAAVSSTRTALATTRLDGFVVNVDLGRNSDMGR
jgi:hypothetical protein